MEDEGKIFAIGVSNTTTSQMNNYGDIQADQEKFNIFQRKSELTGILDYCKNKGIDFFAYSPLAQELLTVKTKPGQTFPDGDVRNTNLFFSPNNIENANLMLEEWKPLSEKHIADLGQITAAWTFEYPGVIHVLLGTRTCKQAVRNSKVGNIQLEEDVEIINTIYEKYLSKPEVL